MTVPGEAVAADLERTGTAHVSAYPVGGLK